MIRTRAFKCESVHKFKVNKTDCKEMQLGSLTPVHKPCPYKQNKNRSDYVIMKNQSKNNKPKPYQ